MAKTRSAASKRPPLTLTEGQWDPKDWPCYFIASNLNCLRYCFDVNQRLLIAVNELRETEIPEIVTMIEEGCSVLIDSGVYNLATKHATKHEVTMDAALSLAPDQIDGFDELYRKYVDLVSRIGPKSWGYIEIDQGGRDNKIRTRARLEAIGLRPIPVYHPFNDGWDYFDELASKYDRICFGNLVQADPATRKRLVATAWERRRKYPGLWIHCLGVTPSDLTVAFPPNSCDSSTWLSGARWGTIDAEVATKRVWSLGASFTYDREAENKSERGCFKAWRLGAYQAELVNRSMQAIAAEQARVLGADPGGFITSQRKGKT